MGSASDHIELTYHDVTVFATPEFKSLEVLEKKIFALILLSINRKTNPNPDLTIKKKTSKKVIARIRTPNNGVEDLYLNH